MNLPFTAAYICIYSYKVIVQEERVTENKKEEEEEDFAEQVVTVPESVGVNIGNLEQTRARPKEVAEITSEEQCNSWIIVVYTRPFQVASPTQTAVDGCG